MSRPDGRIEKGQRLTSAISARAWNRAQDAADIVLGATPGVMAGETVPIEKASNIVLVRNLSEADVPMLGVLAINGVSIDPTGGSIYGNDEAASRARAFVQRPVLNAIQGSPGDTSLVVCLEPIALGSVGRAAIGGCVACKVHVTNTLHTHAGFRPDDNSQLLSSACGPVRLVWKAPGVGVNKWAVGVL